MLLYKYRPLRNFEYLADILIQQRLYCSLYSELNDPFERLFVYSFDFTPEASEGEPFHIATDSTVEDLLDPESSSEIRVCSLSADPSDVRLWSHYGDSHKGVAIEVDFTGWKNRVDRVDYYPTLPKLETPNVRKVLSAKTHHWDYESEYRIIGTSPYFDVPGRIRRVWLGSRCGPADFALLSRLLPDGATIQQTRLDRQSMTVVPRDS